MFDVHGQIWCHVTDGWAGGRTDGRTDGPPAGRPDRRMQTQALKRAQEPPTHLLEVALVVVVHRQEVLRLRRLDL